MYLSYYASRNADALNRQFQDRLVSQPSFARIAPDLFLFSTEECYQKEFEMRVRQLKKAKGGASSEDMEKLRQDIHEARCITRVNSGDLELDFSDEVTERLSQEAISFLLENANLIDYISGIKKAKFLGFDVGSVTHDVLEFGVPLVIKGPQEKLAKGI